MFLDEEEHLHDPSIGWQVLVEKVEAEERLGRVRLKSFFLLIQSNSWSALDFDVEGNLSFSVVCVGCGCNFVAVFGIMLRSSKQRR